MPGDHPPSVNAGDRERTRSLASSSTKTAMRCPSGDHIGQLTMLSFSFVSNTTTCDLSSVATTRPAPPQRRTASRQATHAPRRQVRTPQCCFPPSPSLGAGGWSPPTDLAVMNRRGQWGIGPTLRAAVVGAALVSKPGGRPWRRRLSSATEPLASVPHQGQERPDPPQLLHPRLPVALPQPSSTSTAILADAKVAGRGTLTSWPSSPGCCSRQSASSTEPRRCSYPIAWHGVSA
jgi:hypothetical protein